MDVGKRVVIILTAVVAVLGSFASAGAREKSDILWRVEQPFRFFNDVQDTELHRQAFLSLSSEERNSTILSLERKLAASGPRGWAAELQGKTCWDGDRLRNLCADRGSYIKPAKHRVVVRLEGAKAAEPLASMDLCVWRLAPGSAKTGATGEGDETVEVRRLCREDVALDIPFPAGARVSVSQGDVEIAATQIRVRDIFVVGMGDSFASGEGNPDVPVRLSSERAVSYGNSNKIADLAGYPARVGAWQQVGDKGFTDNNAVWLDQACHRSVYSHQLRVALQLAIEDPHRAVTFLGLACSGAQIVDGLFLRYKGHEWVPDPPLHSQISAVAAAQCDGHEAPWQDLPEAYHMGGQVPELQGLLKLRKCDRDKSRKIDLLLVSIGGNDVGFSRLVANAVLPNTSTLRLLGGWLGQVQGSEEASGRFKELRARYRSLNRALHFILHIPWNEADRVVLTAYPPLALLDDGSSVCPDGNAGMDVISDFVLSRDKAKSSDGAARGLHQLMRQTARAQNWTFVEAHRRGFLGRGICAGYLDSALSSVDDLRLPRLKDGRWVPYDPADYRPYAARQRWFRTPNDAFLTGNFHVSTTLYRTAAKQVQNLQWLQLLLAATYSGAFHPTAEGQAAIADAVIDKSRGVLTRHGQGQSGDAMRWKAQSLLADPSVVPAPLLKP